VRPVEIGWRRTDSVLIRSGLSPGDQVITSRLPSAVPGMRLRVAAPAVKGAQNER
jgi:hypothetical protein